uniref:ATP synthase complex subunit 8 n=1 Tax=Pelagocephalus marki TaxID=862803 RepID=F2EN91_9TELE|nr:ATP synthase F0 subunit 8 [Pelagocephalus marki]BAK10059.1 ATPase subunit 8 [Pelagocephalus marki]
MPQLNPSPWFFTMLLSWFALLGVLPPKIMAHTFSYKPAPMGTRLLTTKPWIWPWHQASSTNS